MKKRSKKLHLSKETLSLVKTDELIVVLGGDPPDDGTAGASEGGCVNTWTLGC